MSTELAAAIHDIIPENLKMQACYQRFAAPGAEGAIVGVPWHVPNVNIV